MPKKKGDKGGNPEPVQTELFLAKQNKRVEDLFSNEPLADKPLTIKLPQFVYDAIQALPKEEKVSWLRNLISVAAVERLGAEPTQPVDIPPSNLIDLQQRIEQLEGELAA
jgi:hypothetical protein